MKLDIVTANSWKNKVLDIVFEALAESDVVVDCLVFKGARVLNKRLRTYSRQSLDIDANMLTEFVKKHESYSELRDILGMEIEEAINNYFEKQDPVVFTLDKIKIIKKPHNDHKLGRDAFEVIISVKDLSRANVRGLPNLKIDIAAPEELGKASISSLDVGCGTVKAYTLERIAGEKLRAFLSSLPAYRKKVSKPGKAIRAKDIYDIARILEQYPISTKMFWGKVGKEFRRACKSRYIDCLGKDTFEEDVLITKGTYNADQAMSEDISFDEAWESLQEIITYLVESKIIPFSYSLPGSE
ncbi:MAG TPA: hypothetical protein ENI64_00215 [Gammaproteobacteria bacterium]|nr:hypothetical protein [Gammaproteobacteria bacterium]